MRNVFKKVVGFVCIASLLLVTTQHSFTDLLADPPPKLLPAAVKKTMYVDSSFTASEKMCIRQAANAWNKVTQGIARITVKEVHGPDDVSGTLGKDHIAVQKFSSNTTAVMILDKLGGGKLYGFYSAGDEISQIYIVSDRLNDSSFCKTVLSHEIGHALGLEHDERPGTLMYEDTYGMSKGITAGDLKAFCVKYDCEFEE